MENKSNKECVGWSEEDVSKRTDIIGDWLILYRKLYPTKSCRQHLHQFLRAAKLYFINKITSYKAYENFFDKYPEWDQWMPFASSFYLTYTFW